MRTDVDDDSEIRARLPEIEDIRNDDVRDAVVDAVRDMPDYFWHVPASQSYHPPEHQSRHGLWLHTKRVCTAFERTAKSMVKQGHLEWRDVDDGRAACLLHDAFKYGRPPTSTDSTVGNHDTIAADWVRNETSLSDQVAGAVESHNGPWYAGKRPTTHLEQMVHVADMHASDANVRVAVKDPHPVLEQQFPRVAER